MSTTKSKSKNKKTSYEVSRNKNKSKSTNSDARTRAGCVPVTQRVVFIVGTPYRLAERTGEWLSIEDYALLNRVAESVGVAAQIVLAVPDTAYAGGKPKPRMSVIKQYRPAMLQEILDHEPHAVVAFGPIALAALLAKGNQPLREHTREELVVPDLPGICCVVTQSLEMMAFKPGTEKWAVLDTLAAIHGRTSTTWGKYTVLQPDTEAWHQRPKGLPKKLGMVGFDLETYPGLDPWHSNARIRMAVLSHKAGRAWVVQLPHTSEFPAWLQDIVSDASITKAGSNIKFDYRWCARFGVELRNMHDTSTAEHILDCTNPLTDLKSLTYLYLPRLGDYAKMHRSLVRERSGWEFVADDEQYQYAGGDGEASIAAALDQVTALRDAGLDRPFQLSMDLYEVLARMETRGAAIDMVTNRELDRKFVAALNISRRTIAKILGPINIQSPKQLAPALLELVPDLDLNKAQLTRQFSDVWYPIKKGEDPDEISTEREILEREAHKHPVIEQLLLYRKLQKLHSVYVTGLYDKHIVLHEDRLCYVHTSYRSDVVETYRLSSQSPNLQNIPRKPEPDEAHPIPLELNIKRQYVSRFFGGQIMNADLSQAEVRIAAHLSMDQVMIEALLAGGDTHLELTARYLGKSPDKVTKLERTMGKRQTFLTLFGGGAKTLASQIGVTKAKAKMMLAQYFDTYKGLDRYIKQVKLDVKRTLYSESMWGYRRRFRRPLNWNTPEGWSVERQAWNHQVQNGAAAYIFVSMVYLEHLMREAKLRSVLFAQVHDSLLIDVFPGEEVVVRELVVEALERPPIQRYGVDNLRVPMVADVEIGPSWGETNELV